MFCRYRFYMVVLIEFQYTLTPGLMSLLDSCYCNLISLKEIILNTLLEINRRKTNIMDISEQIFFVI